MTRGIGRYEVPVFRLGRLAVARRVQGKGLGGELLLAAGWYARFGALRLLDDPLKLVLPLETLRLALGSPE